MSNTLYFHYEYEHNKLLKEIINFGDVFHISLLYHQPEINGISHICKLTTKNALTRNKFFVRLANFNSCFLFI